MKERTPNTIQANLNKALMPDTLLRGFNKSEDEIEKHQLSSLIQWFKKLQVFKNTHHLKVNISDQLANQLQVINDFKDHLQYENDKPFITLTAGEIRTPTEELPDSKNSSRLQFGFKQDPQGNISLGLFQAYKRVNGNAGFNQFGSISIKDLLKIEIIENQAPATN